MKKALRPFLLFFLPVLALASSPEDYYNAGAELFKNHDYEKAIQYFHAAVDERPEYWQAYQSLGMAYYQNGNITAALMSMERSLQLHPENPDLQKFIGNIRRSSPWESKGFSASLLPLIAVLVSLLSSVGTIYWLKRPSQRGPKSPLSP